MDGKTDCYHKLKPEEPRFVILGRDYSGPATVDFWTEGNRFLRKRIEDGATPELAASELRQKVKECFAAEPLVELAAGDPLIDKFCSAGELADDMERWPEKKLAD